MNVAERVARLGPSAAVPLDLGGAFDLHVHAHPSLFPRLTDDLDLAAAYAAAGMAGFVLKSHHESTASRAYLVGRLFPELTVVGGIVLNRSVGGLNPAAVDACLRTGGRVVWMPTLDAAAHVRSAAGPLAAGPTSPQEAAGDALSILDAEGNLLSAVDEVLAIVRDAAAILATGHLSAAEVASLVPAALAGGVERVVVTHPLHTPPTLPLADLAELVALGAFAEFTYTTVSPMWRHAGIEQTREAIGRLGAERCLLVSDGGQRHNPLPPDGLRVFAQSLIELGVSAAEIDRMIRRNPRALLGLDD